MSKKQEDNRDIFDKALDYAPVIGAVGGGVLARRASKGIAKRQKVSVQNHDDAPAHLKRLTLYEGPANSAAATYSSIKRQHGKAKADEWAKLWSYQGVQKKAFLNSAVTPATAAGAVGGSVAGVEAENRIRRRK